jgi:pyruvate formate lyase activating enzyme
MWVRFVLVPGLTDDAENIKPIASFAATLGNVQRVEVLPFHQLGRFKWEKLGMAYELERTEPPTVEAVERAVRIFKTEGLTAF